MIWICHPPQVTFSRDIHLHQQRPNLNDDPSIYCIPQMPERAVLIMRTLEEAEGLKRSNASHYYE